MATKHQLDGDLFASAVASAGATIAAEPPSFLESKVENALSTALEQALDAPLVTAREQLSIPDWSAHLGPVDLVVRLDSGGDPQFVAELKVDDVEATLWDLFKMVAAEQLPSVQAAFLVAAAPLRRWNSDRDCVALFPSRPAPSARWSSRDLFERWRPSWEWLLSDSRARPLRVPSIVETSFVANCAVSAYPGYELRCIAACPSPDGEWIEFDGDWPARAD
jgi:hypothetical protein